MIQITVLHAAKGKNWVAEEIAFLGHLLLARRFYPYMGTAYQLLN